MIREACVENLQESIAAFEKGVERLELCDNLAVGGTSNSYGVLKSVMQAVDIPVMAMVRPRGGNFVYTDAEFESMKHDIQVCKSLGVAGVVSGILLPNGDIDISRTKQLVDMCQGMSFTFHKAFDDNENPVKALEDVIKTGATRLLTSGCQDTASQGLSMLNQLHSQAKGRIIIVAAGKVTHDNLSTLKQNTSITEFHGKRIV